MFTRLKREIKRIIDRGGSPEKRTLNNLELIQNNMQVLHASNIRLLPHTNVRSPPTS
eukprot:UN27603